MKNKILICLSLFAVISLSGCLKKGDDDPAISLRSRKARVAGEWTVVSLKQTTNTVTTSTPPTVSSKVLTSDGKTYTLVQTVNSTSTTDAGLLTQVWEFDKEGEYEITTTMDGVETKSEGRWNFTSSVGETKNKSQLALSEETSTSAGAQTTYTGNYIDEVYDITELRNKTMVLHARRTVTDAGGTFDVEYDIELEAK